ncbi:MAG: tetratricopeptide repeat protein [Planctomycetota bacterium]
MNESEQHDLARQLVEELFDLPQDEQERILAERDVPDGVRDVVRRLLNYDPESGAFREETGSGLRDNLLDLAPTAEPAGPGERLPASIAGFAIEDILGRGGMGVVYRGVQDHPRREVAVKVLHALSASPDRLRRFEYEAEILARLDHPFVAKVFQAGVDEELGGLPYIAMELVDGRDLLAHCDAKELSVDERLKLFRSVCEGVEHAHRHGVVHRDLKPANILVSRDDRPRLLDFGIARPAERDENTPGQTMTGDMIGSLAWMSPEQARGELDHIDTRTDVYSLGAILYRLLAGRMPYDVDGLAPWNAARVVCEEEPPRLGSIRRELAGDLEAICAMALEKEPARRYPSAGAFGRDVQRFLDHAPIDARSWSATQRLRKLVRRHRGLATSLGAILAVVFGGLVWVNYLQIQSNRELAEANAEAQGQAEIAREVNRFLNDDLLAAVQPSSEEGRGIDVTMREVLDQAAERIENAAEPGGRFENLPLVEAEIRSTLASTYNSLGEYARAEPHAERAYALREEHLGADDPATLEALLPRLVIQREIGRGDEVDMFARECLRRIREGFGDLHQTTLSVIQIVGNLYRDQGRFEDSLKLLNEALAGRRATLGETAPGTLSTLQALTVVYDLSGDYASYERVARQTLELQREAHGDDHIATATSMQTLVGLLRDQERFAEAESMARRVVAIRTRVEGPRHPNTLRAINELSLTLRAIFTPESLAEAERLMIDCVEVAREVLGEKDVETATMIGNLGIQYSLRDRLDEARPLLEEAFAIKREVLGDGHYSTIDTWYNLIGLDVKAGDYRAAELRLKECLDVAEVELGEDNPLTLNVTFALMLNQYRQGRHRESLDLAEVAYRLRAETLGELHTDTLQAQIYVGMNLRKLRHFDEALAVMEECLELYHEGLGPDSTNTWGAAMQLGMLHDELGNVDEAVDAYQSILDRLLVVRGEDDDATHEHYAFIVSAYLAGQRYVDAERYARRLVELASRRFEDEDEQLRLPLLLLIRSLGLQSKFGEALPLAERVLGAMPEDHPERRVVEDLVHNLRRDVERTEQDTAPAE